ncbi:Glucose-6-phosphate isomerase [Labeo rohita]|uniref:Glucose-6-phosphate isomerase n=1 Tax=Labeo rohita TaxID=84645 RepID=A0ABQ8M7B9_LABRO|nr:Glucose-6-phosphate isomerase [Labeo rohita]
MRGLPVILAGPSSTRSESTSAALVRDQEDLRVTVRDVPTAKTPRKSRPSKRVPVELPKHDTRSSRGGPSVSFGAPEEDMKSIAASEEDVPPADAGQSSTAGTAQSEIDAELAAMLLRAAKSIELEGAKGDIPPAPAQFLSSRRFTRSSLRCGVTPLQLAHIRAPHSSLPSMEGQPGGKLTFPRWSVQCIFVRKTPPPGGIIRASLPCKLSSALDMKAYGAAGQAASALHAMAILQVYQAQHRKGQPSAGALT